MTAAPFGKECREKEFLLDPEHCFTNHGSYGSAPKVVYEKRMELLRIQEKNPDNWFRRVAPALWKENVHAAAEFLHSKPENLVLVSNATSAINCVVKSIPFTSKDAILVNTWTYKAIQNACHAAITRAGGTLLYVKVTIPIESSADMVNKYRAMFAENPNVKLVVIDYISSASATRWPIEEMIALCKQHNALVLIDGAHAPGQVQFNLEELGEKGVDFFTGNFHKWVYCPRGCAALWIHPRHHDIIRPVVTSHCYNFPSLHDDFYTQGTMDHTPFFVVKDAVEYYQAKGGYEQISTHNTELADRVVEMLLKKWNTKIFPLPKDMEAPYMRLVRLPDLPTHPVPDHLKEVPFGDGDSLMTELFADYNITAVVLLVQGEPWVRISAQIYNSMDDYERLANTVLEIKRKGALSGE